MAAPGRFRRLRKLIPMALNALLFPVSVASRRRGNEWVFGHKGEVFAGNPKYLFLWMAIHRPDIRVTWLTANRRTQRMLAENGYRALRRWSPRGVVAALRAGVFAFSHGATDANGPLSRGAVSLNLWHGVGIKALQVAPRQASPLARRLWRLVDLPHDLVVSSSDRIEEYFTGQFRIPRERCPQLGYPRLDAAADPALDAAARAMDDRAGFAFNGQGFAEVYLYAPTFRDTGRPFLSAAFPDLDRLSEALSARGALLYVKLHPQTLEDLPRQCANIRHWPDEIDFHTYLGQFTGLITDYSSIIYDYLFLRRSGVILYTFDYETYTSQDRGFVYPYEDNVAGLRAGTFDALCKALERGAAFDPALVPQAERIRDRFWSGSASPASPAVVAHVERLLRAGRGRGKG
jgi:CDP-glycerol glycerophosphotransferase (TagB/SpsB family)